MLLDLEMLESVTPKIRTHTTANSSKQVVLNSSYNLEKDGFSMVEYVHLHLQQTHAQNCYRHSRRTRACSKVFSETEYLWDEVLLQHGCWEAYLGRPLHVRGSWLLLFGLFPPEGLTTNSDSPVWHSRRAKMNLYNYLGRRSELRSLTSLILDMDKKCLELRGPCEMEGVNVVMRCRWDAWECIDGRSKVYLILFEGR